MGPSWTLKGNEESGMTLRFGALAPSKKVGCSQNTGNWEYFSAPPFPAHYFQRVLLVLALVNRHLIIPVKENIGPTLKEQGEMDVQTGHHAEREAHKAF